MVTEETYRYHSNGKLLLSGEYLVLHGALSLALPTLQGQYLYVRPDPSGKMLEWLSSVRSVPWFRCVLDPADWKITECDDESIAQKLVQILRAASELRGEISWLEGKTVFSEIEFKREWGLGSSSSLISNIAFAAEIDPFELFRQVAGGSGYDIACARSDKPILFQTGHAGPRFEELDFHPPFSRELHFVYLGRKQDSDESVRQFMNHALVRSEDIEAVSALTRRLVSSSQRTEFEHLMLEHEQRLSRILEKPMIQDVLFTDFPGRIKSLGAWGGDFILAASGEHPALIKQYFERKGMKDIIPYDQMIKAT